MLRVIYNAQTKEITYEEVEDVLEPIIETIQEPTIEQKVDQMQATLVTVVDTLAEIVGVE